MDKKRKHIILENRRRNAINAKIYELKSKIPFLNLSTKEQILSGTIIYIDHLLNISEYNVSKNKVLYIENEKLKDKINNMEYKYNILQMKYFEVKYDLMTD